MYDPNKKRKNVSIKDQNINQTNTCVDYQAPAHLALIPKPRRSVRNTRNTLIREDIFMKQLLSLKKALQVIETENILPSLKIQMGYLLREGYIKVYESAKGVLYKPDCKRVRKLQQADLKYYAKMGFSLNSDYMRLYK